MENSARLRSADRLWKSGTWHSRDGLWSTGREYRHMAANQRDDRGTLNSLIAAWRSGDALRAAAHFGTDGEYGEAGRAPLLGRAAIVEHFTRFFRDGPRWRFEVDDTILDGDRACIVYRFFVEGEGALWRERAGCAIVRFDPNGAIAVWREYEG